MVFQERMQQSQMIKSYICGDQISMEFLEMARNQTPGRMIQRIFIWLKLIQFRLQIKYKEQAIILMKAVFI